VIGIGKQSPSYIYIYIIYIYVYIYTCTYIQVVIGIGKQSRTYIPASKHVTVSKIAARKRLPINVTTTHSPPGYKVPRKIK